VKKLLLVSSALAAFGGQGLAADLPVRMPVKVPVIASVPAFNWTGCYIGAHVGGGWGRKDFSDPTGLNFAPAGAVIEVDTRGALAGGQIGCNYQFATNWVLGIDADLSWTNSEGETRDPFFANKNIVARTEWLATATGQLGYTWERWMLYGKGGAAWARDQYHTTNPALYDFAGTEVRAGWVVGVGLEWALWHRWSAKLEFDHYDFGSRTVTLTDRNLGSQPADIEQRVEAVKFGLNYRFGLVQ